MSKIKLTADGGGGTVSLQAPAATTGNNDLILKLPTTIGANKKILRVDGSGNLSFAAPSGYGAFRVKLSGNQVVTEGTEEILEFNTEQFDKQSWFNTSTYKYTPQIAGIYHVNLQLFWSSTDGHAIKMRARIYKNTELWAEDYAGVDDVYGYHSHNVSALIEMNGSSDYIKFQAYGHNSDNSDPKVEGGSTYGQYSSAFGYLLEES